MPRKGKQRQLTCDDCYFMRHRLCALELGEPCSTFRPAEAELRPPAQLRLLFHAPGRAEPGWAFPTAAERAALYAAEAKQGQRSARARV